MAATKPKLTGRGARTDLACPKCGAQATALQRRASSELGEEPGFPTIGRACRSCTWEEITATFPQRSHKGEHDMRRAYVRGPRPAQVREERGHVCILCGHRGK